MSSFLSRTELEKIGFASLGENVLLSKNVSIYGAERISIGNNVRIDDFSIISGNISLGNHVHIAAMCCLFAGNSGIVMEDFTGISSRSAIYAETDDYSGYALTNPTVPEEFKNVYGGKVTIGKHTVIGTGSTILPGVSIGEGVSVGSMSLVNKNLDEWGIYVGIPCRRIKDRSRHLLEFEKELCSHKYF